jgi:hypothetical protein
MDTLSYDIVIEIIQHINMLNAVSLCRLEQVSKSFQYCAKKSWYNVYFASKKDVYYWLEVAKKRQKVAKELQLKATANRDASLSIIDKRVNSLACAHCRICDPRTIFEIINEQIYFMSQELFVLDETKTITNMLDELTKSMINKQCTTLCCQKTRREYKGYSSIHNNKSEAALSWKLYPLVRNEANIDKTRTEYSICDAELMEAIFAKNMIIRSFTEPEWRPNRPKNMINTQN